MQLILTDEELEAMPASLRHRLFRFLDARKPAGESRLTPLDPDQATALLRAISFHPDGRALHALIERLAHGEGGAAPERAKLEAALPEAERPRLRRHLAALTRLTRQATGLPEARLWEARGAARRCTLHPATRQSLQDRLQVLARSGEAEEPLWE